MKEVNRVQVARKEAGEYRRPAKYRIGIALVVELNDDADVIDITNWEAD